MDQMDSDFFLELLTQYQVLEYLTLHPHSLLFSTDLNGRLGGQAIRTRYTRV